MALIDRIQPNSIKSIADMTLALRLVLEDLFRDVGTVVRSDTDMIGFETDTGNDDTDLELVINVTTNEVDHDERRLLDEWRRSGVGVKEMIDAIEGLVWMKDEQDELAMRDELARLDEVRARIAETPLLAPEHVRPTDETP